jgi:hypothetical protein
MNIRKPANRINANAMANKPGFLSILRKYHRNTPLAVRKRSK